MEPPSGYIPGVHMPGTLIPVQDYDRQVLGAPARRETSHRPEYLDRQEAVEGKVRRLGGTGRLTATTDLDEITRLFDAGIYTRRDPSFATPFEVQWRAAVDATWQRLSEAGTFGPPTHDIVSVHCHWPLHGKAQRLTFEELARQPGWLVLDAQPICWRWGEFLEETRGEMDVWIAADGQTFRREVVFRAEHGQTRAAHDAELNYRWRNDTRQRPVNVAVPAGEPPRTEEVGGFLSPRETKALQDTILLTKREGYYSHTLSHDLGTALAAAIRASRAK